MRMTATRNPQQGEREITFTFSESEMVAVCGELDAFDRAVLATPIAHGPMGIADTAQNVELIARRLAQREAR